MTRISVDGLGERHILAERATLTARVAMAHADRDRSIAAGTALHAKLADRATRLRAGGEATWHSVDVLTTNVRVWTDKDGGKHQDHVTSGAVRIKLGRLDLVSDVVAQLSALGAAVSTEWALTETTKTRATRELRAVAVQDARAKADDFAAALGTSVDSVAALRETSGHAAGGLRGAAGGPKDDLTIPEITVRVSVVGEYETL
ncbi:SIMPL domain-containing protein [Microbacterium hydrocarbonoxydans]|uniref:SIMPL domain-containing protein n=1 Tax=Microbacterium hydrocarbonoxydans TaxID=273678 RepID=UPI0013DADEC2|nr:SIMPL domain-containing protein [Microbacterium hydrocarbonoxydans]